MVSKQEKKNEKRLKLKTDFFDRLKVLKYGLASGHTHVQLRYVIVRAIETYVKWQLATESRFRQTFLSEAEMKIILRRKNLPVEVVLCAIAYDELNSLKCEY